LNWLSTDVGGQVDLSLNPKKLTLSLFRKKKITRLAELNGVDNVFPPIPLINKFLWIF